MRATTWVFSFALLLSTACAGPSGTNLLIISFDTTRADRLTPYGYAQPVSPSLQALAERGVVFERAFTHVPSTLPAHSSLLTGLLPPRHGVRCNGRLRLADRYLSLAEILADQGFDTAAIVGGLPLDARFGLDQGFAVYDDDFSQATLAPADAHGGQWLGNFYERFERRADEVTELALRWLDRRSSPWFLFVHYFDPHTPYAAASPWPDRFPDPYDAELAFADHQLGRLLERVNRLPGPTLIVFTADHGEGLGEHGEPEHGELLYDTTLRVPLIVRFDGRIAAGRRIEASVSQVDVLPTVLELLGFESPAGLDGRSLAGSLLDGTEPVGRPVYGETLTAWYEVGRPVARRSIVDGTRKLIRTEHQQEQGRSLDVELYELGSDPAELTDVAGLQSEQRDALLGRLEAWVRQLEGDAAELEWIELDDETLERLRSLGYLK